MTPAGAPANADAFYRRQLVLAAVSGVLGVGLSAVVGLVLALVPDASSVPVPPSVARAPGPPAALVAALVASTAAMGVLSLFLVRHAVRVARFTLRRGAR